MSVVETPTLAPSDTLLALLDGIAGELVTGTRPGVSLSGLASVDQRIISSETNLVAVLLEAAVGNRISDPGRYEIRPEPWYKFATRPKGFACPLSLFDVSTDEDKLFYIGPYSPGLHWGEMLEGEALAEAKARHETRERQQDYAALGKQATAVLVTDLASGLERMLRQGKLELSPPRQADLEELLRGRALIDLGFEEVGAASIICNVSLQRLTWDDTP